MNIDRVELFHLELPLVHFFETSFGRETHIETLIVKVQADGLTGYGECAASSAPTYSYETIGTTWHINRDWLLPTLLKADVQHPSDLVRLYKFCRGHGMAKTGTEQALWDIASQKRGLPLARLLGGTVDEIPTGISLGIEDTVGDLIARVEESLAKKYRRIKLKIKPGWDVDVIREVRKRFPKILLMGDANSAYSLKDTDHLKRLDEFDLLMIEQPLAYDDYVDHRHLQEKLKTPVCLDECIKSPDDARRAIELKAGKIINLKQARVGGTTEAIRVHDLCRDAGWPVWCGGLLETGVGRAHNIALSTLPNFTLPGDVSASERYYREDIIDPPVTVTDRGTIEVPKTPGLGYQVVESRFKQYLVKHEAFRR